MGLTLIAQKYRRAVLLKAQALAMEKLTPGPEAARSQDFLYDEDAPPNTDDAEPIEGAANSAIKRVP